MDFSSFALTARHIISYAEQPVPFDTQRLIVDGLSCRRGERLLFENLSFAVERGSGLALIGPNGVGKTSLLRILAGLLRPASGSIRLEPQHDVPLTEQSHYIGVQDGLKSSLTPREHVDFWRTAGGDDPVSASRRDYHAKVILTEWAAHDLASIPTALLSTGQRRRVALARLICTARPVWLLDEPLNGLDSWAADNLRRLAVRYMAAGGIVIVASHQPLDWAYMSTLDLGRSAAPPAPSGSAT